MRGSRIGKGAGSGGPPPGKFKLLRVTENTEVSENPPHPCGEQNYPPDPRFCARRVV